MDSIKKQNKLSFSQKRIPTEPAKRVNQNDFNSFLERQKAFAFRNQAKNELVLY